MTLLVGLWLLIGVATAAEPPPRPTLDPDRLAALRADPNRCLLAQGIDAGELTPCQGTLAPSEILLQQELLVRHLDIVEYRFRYQTTRQEERIAELERLLELERAPVPLIERPSVVFTGGMVIGAALVVGVAWSLPREN
ncbi:MAG: hypothetical protein AAFV53_23270 [Myxococcota bacterium]